MFFASSPVRESDDESQESTTEYIDITYQIYNLYVMENRVRNRVAWQSLVDCFRKLKKGRALCNAVTTINIHRTAKHFQLQKYFKNWMQLPVHRRQQEKWKNFAHLLSTNYIREVHDLYLTKARNHSTQLVFKSWYDLTKLSHKNRKHWTFLTSQLLHNAKFSTIERAYEHHQIEFTWHLFLCRLKRVSFRLEFVKFHSKEIFQKLAKKALSSAVQANCWHAKERINMTEDWRAFARLLIRKNNIRSCRNSKRVLNYQYKMRDLMSLALMKYRRDRLITAKWKLREVIEKAEISQECRRYFAKWSTRCIQSIASKEILQRMFTSCFEDYMVSARHNAAAVIQRQFRAYLKTKEHNRYILDRSFIEWRRRMIYARTIPAPKMLLMVDFPVNFQLSDLLLPPQIDCSPLDSLKQAFLLKKRKIDRVSDAIAQLACSKMKIGVPDIKFKSREVIESGMMYRREAEEAAEHKRGLIECAQEVVDCDLRTPLSCLSDLSTRKVIHVRNRERKPHIDDPAVDVDKIDYVVCNMKKCMLPFKKYASKLGRRLYRYCNVPIPMISDGLYDLELTFNDLKTCNARPLYSFEKREVPELGLGEYNIEIECNLESVDLAARILEIYETTEVDTSYQWDENDIFDANFEFDFTELVSRSSSCSLTDFRHVNPVKENDNVLFAQQLVFDHPLNINITALENFSSATVLEGTYDSVRLYQPIRTMDLQSTDINALRQYTKFMPVIQRDLPVIVDEIDIAFDTLGVEISSLSNFTPTEFIDQNGVQTSHGFKPDIVGLVASLSTVSVDCLEPRERNHVYAFPQFDLTIASFERFRSSISQIVLPLGLFLKLSCKTSEQMFKYEPRFVNLPIEINETVKPLCLWQMDTDFSGSAFVEIEEESYEVIYEEEEEILELECLDSLMEEFLSSSICEIATHIYDPMVVCPKMKKRKKVLIDSTETTVCDEEFSDDLSLLEPAVLLAIEEDKHGKWMEASEITDWESDSIEG